MTDFIYAQRHPENTILHQTIKKNLEKFQLLMTQKEKVIPSYVLQEFEDYLKCGDPSHGFARLKCSDCAHEKILPFSCKTRGFCPSCCGRRMNETETHLIGDVFPKENTRQWVLSIPMALRMYGARNRNLINLLLRIFQETIMFLVRKKLRSLGTTMAKGGGVVFIQRLGGALNLNVHFHAVFLDGGYTKDADGSFKFHNIAEILTSEDICWAVQRIALRSVKSLSKLGILEEDNINTASDPTSGILDCDGASAKNLILLGERAGQKVRRRILLSCRDAAPSLKGEMVAFMHGFNLKADKLVKAHQRWKLARLIRYVSRPPVSNERLRVSEDSETVHYFMKRAWSDGTYEVLFSGVELVEKLASAVPPPRGHLVRYIGVLAPNSHVRSKIVLKPKPKARSKEGRLSGKQRIEWAELIKRTFGIDLNKCEKCSGQVKRIAVIRDPKIISKIVKRISAGGVLKDLENTWQVTSISPRAPPNEPFYEDLVLRKSAS